MAFFGEGVKAITLCFDGGLVKKKKAPSILGLAGWLRCFWATRNSIFFLEQLFLGHMNFFRKIGWTWPDDFERRKP